MHTRRPTISDRKVRFAVIGCGRIAQNHFEAVKKHADRAEILALQRASRFIPTRKENYQGIEQAAKAAGLLK